MLGMVVIAIGSDHNAVLLNTVTCKPVLSPKMVINKYTKTKNIEIVIGNVRSCTGRVINFCCI